MLHRGPHKVSKPSERASARHKDPHATRKTETPTATAERAARRGTHVRLHTAHSALGGPKGVQPLSARQWLLSNR